MKTVGNIIWLIFGGLEWALALIFVGLIWCITIIGIPVGVKMFHMATFVIWPFGKSVNNTSVTGFKTVLNVIWAILFGWIVALGFLFTGVIFCITIIGIPFGLQYFKMAKFVLLPLGRTFEK